MTVFISLDGVLRTEVGDPIHQGLKLFRTLVSSYRVVLATDGSLEEAEHWLRSNLLTGHAHVYDNRVAFEGQDLRLRQLAIERANGGQELEMFIDPDPDRCQAALSSGITTILFSYPKFIRRKRNPKAWDVLKKELEAQKELTAKLVLDEDVNLKRWE